jgi:CheY-like chemotaxis protein
MGKGDATTGPLSARSGPRRVSAWPPARGRLRVLVVDDARDHADSLCAVLRLAGHEALGAYDGAEALRLASAHQPDVVVLDLGLPDLDGEEVCQRLRREPWGSALKIVALTGSCDPQDRDATRAAGFDHHLTKPVVPSSLLELIEPTARRVPA